MPLDSTFQTILKALAPCLPAHQIKATGETCSRTFLTKEQIPTKLVMICAGDYVFLIYMDKENDLMF